MTPLFSKLNYKAQSEIFIINHPHEFEKELQAIKKVTTIKIDLKGVKEIFFILSFVKSKEEIEKISSVIETKLIDDAIVWFAFPKGTSKKYKVEINRDNGWEALGKKGFEPVRAVSIDEDWSALRFRKVEFIKTMTRNASFAMTAEGKMKAKKK